MEYKEQNRDKVFFLTPLFRLQGGCPSTPPQGHAYYPQLRYAFATCKKPASPTATSAAASDWGSLLLRRARALARGAAHPSGTGGAALAKPAPVPCWRRLAARQQPVCPTNGATSPRRPRGGELAGLHEAASLAIPAPADLRARMALRCRAPRMWTVCGARRP